MRAFIYGQRVFASEKYERRYKRKTSISDDGTIFEETWKVWLRESTSINDGLYLGLRTLQNVALKEKGFEPREYFSAALISPGLKKNPVYVPINSLLPVYEEGFVIISKKIDTCTQCRYLDHSGGFTPGGAQMICDHPAITKNHPEWTNRVLNPAKPQETLEGIPKWCPLKDGADY